MTPEMGIPAGGVIEAPRPAATQIDGSGFGVRYHRVGERPSFAVPVPAGPAAEIQLDVEIREEDGVLFLSALQLDVAVEAPDPSKAFHELRAATRSWLEYMRDEDPALSDELEPQRRFVALLDYHPATWFKRLVIAE